MVSPQQLNDIACLSLLPQSKHKKLNAWSLIFSLSFFSFSLFLLWSQCYDKPCLLTILSFHMQMGP